MKRTIIEALDERDLLASRISTGIDKLRGCVGVKVKSEALLWDSTIPEGAFNDDIRANYQSVNDLIARYHRINEAIANANANTKVSIKHEDGVETMTLAAAIALRDNLNNRNYSSRLTSAMKSAYEQTLRTVTNLNDTVRSDANRMVAQILGKNAKDAAAQNSEALAMSKTYYDQHCFVLVDPLDIANKIDEIEARENEELAALKVAIKIANATTEIDI